MAVRLVKIVNNTNTCMNHTMNDGKTHVDLTQFIKGKESHISQVLEYGNIPDSFVKKNGMIARGLFSIIDV